MRNIDPTVYLILSAELSTLDPERNQDRSLELETLLDSMQVPYKRLAGKYKTQTERSYIVPFSAGVLKAAKLFGQESVLKLHPDNKAELIYLETGQSQIIGTLQKVSKAEALELDAWSYRPDLNQFYAVK